MNRDERLYELFARAIGLAPAEREAFCARECGDDVDLRRELATLLDNAPADDDRFLDGSALSPAAITDLEDTVGPGAHAPAFPDPEQVGPYRILARLGEGGMGVVYLAEQHHPVRRQVALKVIKPGMDTARVVRRFEMERQALAVLDHPGIARIHDAGATAEGRPYFAMERVAGRPLQDYCTSARLPTAARLELFVRLCEAVQHAHQKGIIHRDLKPSNVLVTERDGVPQPVIIDFGIARAVTDGDSDRSQLTRQHEMVGTFDYMAPEQAGEGADVDSRADIYSLGVLLFELLTGERPYDRTTPVGQRAPHAPSTRIGRSAATTAAAASQATDVRALRRLLRGELDWITIKALEPDRERRYASASELAGDVRRYLDKQPVLAGPPGAWYRLRTFARRHRAGVTAAAAVLVTLIVGGIVTVLALFEAQDQRDAAKAAQEKLQTALGEAEDQRAAAERERASAAAATDFMVGLLRLTNPERNPSGDKQLDQARRALLDLAAAQVGTALAGQPRAEALARTAIGDAYATFAEPRLALEHLLRAVELIESQPTVDPLELYEALWTCFWPLDLTGQGAREEDHQLRCYGIAIELFALGGGPLAPHPRLAQWYRRISGSFDDAEVATLVGEARPYAEAALGPGDPRWVLLGDLLVDASFRIGARRRRDAVDTPIDDAWSEWVATIYPRAGVQDSDTRSLLRELTRFLNASFNGEHAKVIAWAESAAARFERVLPDHHWFHVVRLCWHGVSLVAIGDSGQVEAGLRMLERAADAARAAPPEWISRRYVLAVLVQALEEHGSVRVAALRSELTSTILQGDVFGPRPGDLEAALGPGYADLLARIRKWGPGDVPELLALCRQRAAVGREAALVAAGLVWRPTWLAPLSPEERIALESYCLEVGQETGAGYEHMSRWRLASWLLHYATEPSQLRRVLLLCDEGIARAAGVHAGWWRAKFRLIRGGCRGQLAESEVEPGTRDKLMADAETDLRAAYEALAASGQVVDRATDAYLRLQDHLLRSGRQEEGVAFATERLRLLLRLHEPAAALYEAVWSLVRLEPSEGAPARLAVDAARKAVALEPETWQHHFGLGAALVRNGAPSEALEALAEAARLRPIEDRERPSALPAFQALAHARLGQADAARPFLETARQGAEAAPDRIELRQLASEVERALGGR